MASGLEVAAGVTGQATDLSTRLALTRFPSVLDRPLRHHTATLDSPHLIAVKSAFRFVPPGSAELRTAIRSAATHEMRDTDADRSSSNPDRIVGDPMLI
jgi:hypothetical protein